MITIKENIDIIDEVNRYDVILVGTNVYGKLTNGWQRDIKLKYPILHKVNIETRYGDISKMGNIVEVQVEESLKACLLYITKGYNFRPDLESDYLSYESLKECLQKINILYKGKRIACPILGSSKFDGNGDREKILNIFNETLTHVDATLYDYEQISDKDKDLAMIKQIMGAKTESKQTKDVSKYHELVRQRKAYQQRMKLINNLKIFEK